GFFHIHAGEVSEQHGGWSHDGFTQRGYRKLKRKTSGFAYATFYDFSEVAQVTVARSKFRPGITNPDNRFVFEVIIRIALVAQPRAVHKTHFIGFTKPIVASEFFGHVKIIFQW